MKTVLAFLFVFSSLQSFAAPMPDADSTWRELSRDHRVIFQLPQFSMSHGFFMRANSVCVDGDNIRSIKKVEHCVEYRGRNDRCVEWETIYPSKAINGTTRECVRRRNGRNDTCLEWADVPYELSLEHDIKVYRRRNGGRDGDDFDRSRMFNPLFTKNLTIGQCL